MAVVLAGQGLDPRFGWTSCLRRALAGTEVAAVSGTWQLLLTYDKVMIEFLEETSVGNPLRNPSFFGHSLSMLWPSQIQWPRFGRASSLPVLLLTV